MNQQSQNASFEAFRGRQGTAKLKSIRLYVERFLGVDTKALIAEWVSIYDHVAKHEGKLQAVRKCKDYYNQALRLSCGIKTDPLLFVQTSKDGYPKKIRRFVPYLNGTPDSRRAALTILQLYKLVPVEPPYALTSITDPYGGKENLEWLDLFKKVVQREFPLSEQQSRIDQLKPGYHISGSNGPNGSAIGTAYVDREAIRGTNIESSVKRLASLTRFKYLSDLLASTGKPTDVKHKSQKEMTHSRIRIKYEPGGKARPFAICDFFSQSSLKSIHDFTMDWLKKRETDSSSNHSVAANSVREWSGGDVPLWSYDLTSATDRFPVFLQLIVLEQMFGSEIKDCWKDILINRTFTGPNNEKVRFQVGQPLGLLSSWSVFSITHHLLVQTAAAESIASQQWFNSYRMIGDDICIAKYTKVASKYRDYLDDLGVDISLNKSILPEQAQKGNAAEIAKRLFHMGIEVTPVPPLTIIEGFRNPVGFKNLIESSWNRGYQRAASPYPVQSIPGSLLEWSALTFPIRNRCPQLNGVTSMYPKWELTHEAPAGLATGWFIWAEVPYELIVKAVRRFLFERVNTAVRDSLEIQQRVLLARYMKSERESLPQGGDWQPGTLDVHPEIIGEVFSELQETLMANQSRLWDDNFLLGEVSDLYVFIGSLHKYLEPKTLLQGRAKITDQKDKTVIFVSAMVKYVSKIAKQQNWEILDQAPEVESFPMADDLDFALIEDEFNFN